MDVSYVFAGLPVTNRDRSAAWYERLLGRPADMLPNDAEAAWQLTPTASVYLVVDPHRAGGGVLTLIVDDLDSSIARVTARGIGPGQFIDVPGAGRKCALADPDGNAVSVVELVAP